MKSGRFLRRIIGLSMKFDLPLMKNVLKRLAKSVWIPWRLTTAVSTADTEIDK